MILQGLSEKEEERVREANLSYEAMVELIFLLISLGIAVSVENPLNSLFWLTSFMVKLFQRFPGHLALHAWRNQRQEIQVLVLRPSETRNKFLSQPGPLVRSN